MLSPDVTNTKNLLSNAFFEMQHILGYAHTANNLFVGYLKPDPDWLPAVRSRIGLLSKAGSEMTIEYPDIWSPILVAFINYTTIFSGLKNKRLTADKWIQLLKTVETELNTCISATKSSIQKMETRFDAFKNIQPLLAKSIEEGWEALSDEEQQMIKIVQALTRLQDEMMSLESKLTSDAISGGTSAVKSTATILYGLVTAAEVSIPFLSVAALVFTVGKTFYDIISTTDAINNIVWEIGDLQLEASQEAQALAGTKMVLQTLYNLELRFESLRDYLPGIEQMWAGELGKVQAVIEALESGVDPDTYMEIQSLPMACSIWSEVETFVQQISNFQFEAGPAVELKTSINKSKL